MKKLISGIIAFSIALCSASGVFAAVQYSSKGSVLIESDIKAATNTKKSTVNNSAKAEITKLFSWAAVETKRASEKKIIITSEAGRIVDGTEHPFIPNEISLRITNPDASKKSSYVVGSDAETDEDDGKLSIFEYFTLIVKDADGNVVYEAQNVPSEATEISIPLKLFNYDYDNNTTFFSDEATYTISLMTASGSNASVTEYAYPTKWKWYIDVKQRPDYAYGIPEPTAEPEETAEPAAAKENETSAAKETPLENTEDEPLVTPYETEETNAPSKEDVPQESKSPTATARPAATPRVKATTTPRPTATPKAGTSAAKTSATPKATTAPSAKSNPKTGDTAPLTALSVLGIASIAVMFIIQGRRKND